MTEATWEKPKHLTMPVTRVGSGRWKFLVGGVLILAAVTYLIISSTTAGARYFITVKELLNDSAYVNKTIRISGAVIGDTIQYDEKNLVIDFAIANIPADYTDLSKALYESVNDPKSIRVPVHIVGQVKPDLLKHEAQAILTGTLDKNGVFQATELLLKCPTKFQDANPGQTIVQPGA
jgi:cytochrome c-type biogenesis protein CcmE